MTAGSTYYNEWDSFAAQWLRNLIKEGHLPAGDVDERDIREIMPGDLKGYAQCHFFAGIGGWAYALSLAGWPAGEPVWTGSCPCQPFSGAGKRLEEKDERHLWPAWFQLIRECQPSAIFGEQVASNLGREWLSGVRADLETLGYAVGAADLCAAGIGSPQIRQRLWWVGIANGTGSQPGQQTAPPLGHGHSSIPTGNTGGLPDSPEKRSLQEQYGPAEERSADPRSLSARELPARAARHSSASGIPNAEPVRRRGRSDGDSQGEGGPVQAEGSSDAGGIWNSPIGGAGALDGQSRESADAQIKAGGPGFWSDFDILPFQDGKARRIEPGTFPLAHGVPARVGRLRGYGNSINPQTAAEFIRAYREVRG